MTWDQKFLQAAQLIATWSKDPNHKVGCVIVDDDHNQLSGGYNGFPRGVKDDDRLNAASSLLDTKLRIIVHAEANAVAAAARNGHSLKGGTAYITSAPCCQCASLLIQAGVKRVVIPDSTLDPNSKWAQDMCMAITTLQEAEVQYNTYPGCGP